MSDTPRPAIELAEVTKIYRKFGRKHFATLKSALLNRSIVDELQPTDSFTALRGLSLSAA